MACGTQVVPGYKEFNAKMKDAAKDPGLETKINQLITKSVPKKLSTPMKT